MTLIEQPQFNTTIKIVHSDSRNGEFLITPLEKNIGSTLGNTIRRLLLGIIPGFAITSVYIKNIRHEFSPFPGMKEDIIDFLSSLQSLLISMDHYGPSTISIRKKGPGIITGQDVICPKGVRIINPSQYLCTINEISDLHVDLVIESGIGYLPATYELNSNSKTNEIKLDAIFSPITHVCYRLKHFTFYEELLFHVQTDGTVSPQRAFEYSMQFLLSKFNSIEDRVKKNSRIE